MFWVDLHGLSWLFCLAFLLHGAYAQCHKADEATTPVVNCPDVCPQDWNPVCGKHGDEYKEFGNNCFLKEFNCKHSKKYSIVDKKYCDHVTFTPSQQTQCPGFCPEIWDPICGKRGVDEYREFGNSCFMAQFNCKNDTKYIKVDKKLCEEPPRTTTNCPDVCSANYKPVCGKSNNDYRVFSNACYLAVHNCRHSNKYIKVAKKFCDQPHCADSNGPPVCGYNGHKHTLFRSRCDLNMYNYRFMPKYHEVANIRLCDIQSDPRQPPCNSNCPDIYKPVCGGQGNQFNLFANECQLRLHNCKYNDHFQPQTDMKKCHCPGNVCTREYAPICATNGHSARVYNNMCLLQTANCQSKNGLLPVNDIFCSDDSVWHADASLCENQYYPVCALATTDGPRQTYRLFDNPCSVHALNCATKNDRHDIIIVDLRNCAGVMPVDKCDLLVCSDYHYDPVCGVNNKGKTMWFASACVLQYYNCHHHGNATELGYKLTEGLSCY